MNIRRQLRFICAVFCLSTLSATAIAGSPVAIDCPCSLSRVNPTAVEIDFNLIFTQSQSQSGALEIYLYGHDTRHAALGGYYELAVADIDSIGFSNSPVAQSLTIPFYYTGFETGYMSLVLVDADTGETLDMVPLTAQPVTATADAGVAVKIGSCELFFAQQPTFAVFGSSYQFDALNITNSSNPLGSDNLFF